MISQILHPKLFPNSLHMVIVTPTNSGHVEFAVKCFSWAKLVLFDFFLAVHVFIRISSLSKQQSELFFLMSNCEIMEDWFNLLLLMAFSSALTTCSISNVVLINVYKFCFAFALIVRYSISPNQIPGE